MQYKKGGNIMAKIIAVANEKGGVGKTTTVLGLSECLQSLGKKILVLDGDPQCNTTSSFKAVTKDENTMYDFYMGQCSLKDSIQTTERGDIVPNDKLLKRKEAFFMADVANFSKLRNGLKDVKKKYDYIIIDTPPNSGFYSTSALIAADEVVIPIAPEMFSADGLGDIIETINDVKNNMNRSLKIRGVMITMYDSRQTLDRSTRENLEKISKAFKIPFHEEFCIRKCQDIKNAQARKSTLEKYKSKCAGYEDYMNAAKIIMMEV